MSEHPECEKHIHALQHSQDELNKRIFAIEEFDRKHLEVHQAMMEQLRPISDVFNNVNGFRQVSILILKGLALLGAGLGVVYAVIKFLRNQ